MALDQKTTERLANFASSEKFNTLDEPTRNRLTNYLGTQEGFPNITRVKGNDLVQPKKNVNDGFMDKVKVMGSETYKSVVRSTMGVVSGTGGLIGMMGDSLKLDDKQIQSMREQGISEEYIKRASSLGNTLSEWGTTAKSFWEKAQTDSKFKGDEQIFKGSFTENFSWTRTVSTVAGAIPSLGAATVATLATKNPAVGITFLSGIEVEDTYYKALEAGKSKDEARALAGVAFAGVATLEATLGPLNRFLKGGSGKALKDIVIGGIREGGTEGLQQIWQNMVDKVGIDKTQDLFEGVVESIVAGAGSGGVIGGLSSQSVNNIDNIVKEGNITEEELSSVINATESSMTENNEVIEAELKKNVEKSKIAIQEIQGEQLQAEQLPPVTTDAEGKVIPLEINTEEQPLIEEAKKYKTAEEFKALGFDAILKDVRGIERDAEVIIPTDKVEIKWKDDYDNALDTAKKEYNPETAPPVDFIYDFKSDKYILDDGHNRFVAAERNNQPIKGVVQQIEGNMNELDVLYKKEKGESISDIWNKAQEGTVEEAPDWDAETEITTETIKAKKGISLLDEKIQNLKNTEVINKVAKETLDYTKTLQKDLLKKIAPYEGGKLKEEYADIPNKYKTKKGSTMDQVADQLSSQGINVSEATLSEYLKNLDSQIERLKVQIQETKPNIIKMKELSSLKKRVSDISMGIKQGKYKTTQEIKGLQKEYIDIINKSGLDAKDKAKFLSSVKEITNPNKLSKKMDEFYRRASAYSEQLVKNIIDSEITKQLKYTKPVKKGVSKTGKYDYESNKAFDELRNINKLTKEQAKTELEKLGEPQSEFDNIKARMLELKVNGKLASSPAMYQKVLEDIEFMKAEGQRSKNEEDFIAKMGKVIAAEDALKGISKVKADKKTIKTKIGNMYRKGFTNIYSMFNSIGGKEFADKYNPELSENARETAKFFKTKETAEQSAKILDVKANKFNNTITDMASEKYELVDFQGLKTEINKLDLLDIYNSVKNEAIKNRYYDSFGEQQINELLNNVTEKEALLADYMQEVAQEYYEVFNQRNIELNNRDLGKVDNYWPATSEREIDVFDDFKVQGETPSALKERARGKVIPVPKNAWLKLQRHIAQGEHVRHLSSKYAELKKMLSNRKVKHDIKTKFGEDVYNVMMKQIDNLSLNKQTEQLDAVSGALGKLLNNWVTAKVAISPSVFAKQLISVGNYIENMDSVEWTKYFAEGVANHKKTFDFMWKNAPFLEARYGRGYSEAINRAMEEAGKMSSLKNNWSKAMTALVRSGDIGAIVYGGYPVVKAELAKHGDMKKAIAVFEAETLKSQQSGLSSSLSEFQNSKNPMTRLLLAFKNTANQYFRKQADAIISYQNGDIDIKQLSKTLAIYGVIQPTLYASMGFAVRGLLYGSDDDDIFGDILIGLANNPFNAIPVIDDLANFAMRKAMDKPAWNVFSMPLFDDIAQGMRTLTKEDVTFFDVLEVTGTLGGELSTGAPVGTYKRIIKNAMGNN